MMNDNYSKGLLLRTWHACYWYYYEAGMMESNTGSMIAEQIAKLTGFSVALNSVMLMRRMLGLVFTTITKLKRSVSWLLTFLRTKETAMMSAVSHSYNECLE